MLVALLLLCPPLYSYMYTHCVWVLDSCCFERCRRTHTHMYTQHPKFREYTHLLNGSEHLNVCARVCTCLYGVSMYYMVGDLEPHIMYVCPGYTWNQKPQRTFFFSFPFPSCAASVCVRACVWIFRMRTPPHNTHRLTRTSCTQKGDMGKCERHRRFVPLFPTVCSELRAIWIRHLCV